MKKCLTCCYWQQCEELIHGLIFGDCTCAIGKSYLAGGVAKGGRKYTTWDWSCDAHAIASPRTKACDGNDGCPRCVAAYKSGIRKCTKLVELEKRLACDEKEIIVNRLAYDRHIQQHNGETVT